ncbi:MAG TPA: alpha-D-ribose 1-methylphosphonate 5-phosphate C-P-lyase PhnJ, partial [Trebonia sp.]
MSTSLDGYNLGYLDEQTKRMIRRALLKAVAIPGFQVPFASREVPMPRGWGTGGVQVTASIIGQDDVLKVIDQGADDTTNAVSIRSFFAAVAGVRTTTRTDDATIIQTRHRITETPLAEGQTIVYQVPGPEPLRFLEPRETETRRMHALADYGLMYVKLYEDIARYGHIATTYDYPVMVNGRYLMAPSPIPSFDNPKMHRSPALQLFGAGREKRIYAVPPYTDVESLGFEDYPFEPQRFEQPCSLCGSTCVYLDEVITDDAGGPADRAGPREALRLEGVVLEAEALDVGVRRDGVDALLAPGAEQLQGGAAVHLRVVEARDGRRRHEVAAVDHDGVVVGGGDVAVPGDVLVQLDVHEPVV